MSKLINVDIRDYLKSEYTNAYLRYLTAHTALERDSANLDMMHISGQAAEMYGFDFVDEINAARQVLVNKYGKDTD